MNSQFLLENAVGNSVKCFTKIQIDSVFMLSLIHQVGLLGCCKCVFVVYHLARVFICSTLRVITLWGLCACRPTLAPSLHL